MVATLGGGSGEIAVSWNPVAGAEQYRVYWSELPGGTKLLLNAVDAGLPQPFLDFGRSQQVGKDCYQVSATLMGGVAEGPLSDEACFQP